LKRLTIQEEKLPTTAISRKRWTTHRAVRAFFDLAQPDSFAKKYSFMRK